MPGAETLSKMQVPVNVPWLTEYVDSVNSELMELHPLPASNALEEAVADALSIGGKRVRAILALLWCEVYSGDYRPAVPLGAAYELAHASALIQDDIIDRSEMRRGSKSIGTKYGLTTAILASDLLLFNVPREVAKYGGLDSRRLAKIFDLVGEACRATTWGEYLDMEMAQGAEGTEKDYEDMIRLKTSTLLSAPCASGALVGGATYEQAAVAGSFGEELGVAYQIQDDALDIVGDESALGKPTFTDMRGGKKSVILLHCINHCSGEDRKFVLGLLNREGPYGDGEVSKLKKLIEEKGSLEYAKGRVLGYTAKAREVLASAPDNGARARLNELTDYLAARYY